MRSRMHSQSMIRTTTPASISAPHAIALDDGAELVIHAMPMRPKYRRLLPGGER